MRNRVHFGDDGQIARGRRKNTGRVLTYNVKVTKHVVDFSHPFGVSVEGEIDYLGFPESAEAAEAAWMKKRSARLCLTDLPDRPLILSNERRWTRWQ